MKTSVAGRPSFFASIVSSRAALLVLLGLTAPAAVSASGLASLDLNSYYQPEPVRVAGSEKPWNLPLAWHNLGNAAEVRGRLNLSGNACAALERNGFVVTRFGSVTNVIGAYAWLRQTHLPLFITSDSLLHLYHVQFDDILKCVETNEFLPRLVTMTTTLLTESLQQGTAFSGDLQEAAWRNTAFLAVAARLLGQAAPVPAGIAAQVDQELALITAHNGFSPSPIFKYGEDYSQYVPRGHYTRSDELKQYFKAMMWYGRVAFLLKGADNFGPMGEALISKQDARIQTLQAALLTLALDRLQADGQPIADTWNRIYAVTAFFVGLADDLTPYEYMDTMVKLFGAEVTPEVVAEEPNLFTLKKELASLRSPQIYGGTGNCALPPDATPDDLDRVLDKTKGMRLMGQRFIPDSFMFQQLVLPVTGRFAGTGHPFTMEVTPAGPQRCFPRGLDAMAVLGSRLAMNILDREGDTAYAGYDASLNKLIGEFDSFSASDWQRNLYWAWLHALRPLLAPCGPGSPAFMQTPAWQAKQLNTALASWSELRHDTILYSKQSTTPVIIGIPDPPIPGYVEPLPEFYQRLLSLTRMTRLGLDDLQVLTAVQQSRLLVLEDILLRLRDVAVAELESTPLTEAQCNFIAAFDGVLMPLTNGIAEGLDTSTTLVADVHTDGNTSQVLEEGVGFLNLMIVASQLPGSGAILSAGPVMSYYEFKWPMNDRLTDEHWCGLLAAGQQPAAPAWTSGFAEPVTLPPEDADGDRLPDAWERSYWASTATVNDRTADADGDGLSNEQEAIAGTDPTNPASALRLRASVGQAGAVELRWQSVLGRTYRMRCSEELSHWRLLGTPVVGTVETAVFSDAAPHTAAARFYQLEVIP